MKILVTGGSGFIGSNFVKTALKHNHSVINVDALTYASSTATLKSLADNSNYYFYHLDIRDKASVEQIVKAHLPDAIVHLAAESHVDRSISGPNEFIQTNIVGTFNLLEIALSYWKNLKNEKPFRFIHVSTDEVFGSLPIDPSVKFHEKSSYKPNSPYSATKASSDHLVRAWNRTYGMPTIITNCSNNYGPYQFPEKLIPVVILNAIKKQQIPIYGKGQNVRDWLYVGDHANALLKILEDGVTGENYNIGGNSEISNIDLVKHICAILDDKVPLTSGSYSDLITFIDDRPGHDLRYAINANKLMTELNWSPSESLVSGLKKTVEWYLNNECWWKPLLKSHPRN